MTRTSTYELEINRHRTNNTSSEENDRSPLAFHQSLPGYAPTKLHDLQEIAELLQVKRVLAKDESLRFGLPSFKILGAWWGTFRALSKRMGNDSGEQLDLDELKQQLGKEPDLTLIAATDGNHGRAVARIAKLLNLRSEIFVPAWLSEEGEKAIAGEGASVTRIKGGYDEAVTHIVEYASKSRVPISDTAWPGYTEVPSWIVDGYSTIFWEVDDELSSRATAPITTVAVQIGVGSLAAAVVRHFQKSQTKIIGVEPLSTASLLESARIGSLVSVEPTYTSIMAGLNCGVPSDLAWPLLRDRVDAFVAIGDMAATRAVDLLGENELTVGEAGAAGLGGLLELLTTGDSAKTRDQLAIDADSVVLLVLTEGATNLVGSKWRE